MSGTAAAVTLMATSTLGALAASATSFGFRHHIRYRSPADRATLWLASTAAADVPWSVCKAEGGCGPSVTAPTVLATGRQYVIRVSGTIGVWDYWTNSFCGQPENRPVYPTIRYHGRSDPVLFPHLGWQRTTLVSDDAQFRFAINRRPANGVCPKLPRRMHLFQIDLGSGWFAARADGDQQTPSTGQHTYGFTVTGEGSEPSFRYVDFHPSDNTGEFKIQIFPAASR